MNKTLKLPYTVQEVAEMVGCSTSTILRDIHSGILKARHKKGQVRVWYITDEALKDWTENMLEDI